MRKLIFIILALLIPCTVSARDNYYKANAVWNTEFTIDTHVNVKSTNLLGTNHIILVKKTYGLAENKFLQFWHLKHNECRFLPLEVRIVKGHKELDNREYFPNENDYADSPEEGTEIITGRYFRLTNRLYVVPPYTNKYYWKKNFVHETLHYFFDECGIKFADDDKEHKVIEKFLQKYKRFFY
jgi:hypothetical protein